MSSLTMMPMSLEEIAQAVQGRLIAGTAAVNTPVATSAFTDSRQIVEGSVFVAIAGERVDGHDYVPHVGAQGAVAAIVDHEIADAGVPQIVVEDTVLALGALAKHNIERRRALGTPFTVVGITGSVGKTTTKDLMKALLSHMGPTVAPVGSFNNEIGLPLTSLKVNAETRFLVAEMGANHVGEIANLTSLVPPDIAVVLKVGVAHLGEFGSAERIAQAKSEIIHGLVPGGLSVLNANDEHVAAMSAFAPGDVMWFGLPNGDGGNPAITAQHVRCDELDHPSFTLENGDGEHAEVTLGICGQHNVMNALAAASVAMRLGMSIGEVASVLSDVTTISPHRMAVSTLLELGPDEKDLHVGIGRYALEGGVDALLTVGSASDASLDALAGAMADGASLAGDASHVDWVHDIDEADRLVTRLAVEHPGAVVLLKGSHASGLSALAERWQALAAQYNKSI